MSQTHQTTNDKLRDLQSGVTVSMRLLEVIIDMLDSHPEFECDPEKRTDLKARMLVEAAAKAHSEPTPKINLNDGSTLFQFCHLVAVLIGTAQNGTVEVGRAKQHLADFKIGPFAEELTALAAEHAAGMTMLVNVYREYYGHLDGKRGVAQ